MAISISISIRGLRLRQAFRSNTSNIVKRPPAALHRVLSFCHLLLANEAADLNAGTMAGDTRRRTMHEAQQRRTRDAIKSE